MQSYLRKLSKYYKPAIIVLVGLGALTTILFLTNSNTKPSSQIPDQSEFATFKNDKIGIEFQYPKEWGDLSLSFKKGSNSGEKFEGLFGSVDNTWIEVGGVTKDFSEGRGSVFTDFDGYTVSELKKYEPNSTIKLLSGQQAVLLENKEISMVLSKSDRAVLINLPGPTFYGIAFKYVRPDQNEAQKFDEMIKSIKITR